MNQLFSLRIVLPLIISVFTLLTLLVSFQVSRTSVVAEVVEKVTIETRTQLTLLQGAIDQLLRLEQPESIEQIVAALASKPDLLQFMVVDPDGMVIASADYASVGKPWQSIGVSLSPALIEKVQSQHSTEIWVDHSQRILEGYSSLCVDAASHRLRTNQCGFILYRLDLEYHYYNALSSLRREAVYNGLGILLGALLLVLGVDFLVTRRVRKITLLLNRFSAGERSVRSSCWGQDELRLLGDTVNTLLDRVVWDETEILDREKRLDTLFDIIIDAIIVIDEKGTIERVNQATAKLFGYREEELRGQNVRLLMPSQYSAHHDGYLQNYMTTGEKKIIGIGREVVAMRRDGSTFPIELSISEMRLENVTRFVGVIRDISQRKVMEERLLEANQQLEISAYTDSLTGLANRRRFDEVLREELNRATRNHRPVTLMICDVDFFKKYNDHYGHQAGDRCLQQVAQAIGQLFHRSGELAARYGGEEFAVILPDTDQNGAEIMAKRLLEAVRGLQLAHAHSEVAEFVTLSLGYSVFAAHSARSAGADQFIHHADEALYQAKHAGRNRFARGADSTN